MSDGPLLEDHEQWPLTRITERINRFLQKRNSSRSFHKDH